MGSKDILYFVISFCIVWTTVFLCWVLYYLARLLRNANQIVEEFRVRLQVLLETINYVRGKVEDISHILTLAENGVSGLVRKVVKKKTDEWINHGMDKFDETAKQAVNKAVEATTNQLKKTVKAIKK